MDASHVHGFRKTLDGNMKLGHYKKKHDVNDVSLYGGDAYFVKESDEKEYLANIPRLQKDRTTGNKDNYTSPKSKPKSKKEQLAEIQDKMVSWCEIPK